MISKKHSSTALMILGGVVAAIGVVFIIRLFKKGNPQNDDSVSKSPASQPKQAPASSFPVKYGSKNELVKQLQTALGIAADGDFGPKTQAALIAQTGKTSIATQADFNTIITTLQNKPAVAAAKTRAESLTSQFLSNPLRQLMPISNVVAYGVIQDASKALNSTGKNISLVANQKLSRYDYQPSGSTTSGYLLFDVLNGAFKGKYKVDATKMTVV